MEIIHSERIINLKVVYYGPALCGKTTNLNQTFDRLKPEQRLSSKVEEVPTESDRTLKYEFVPLTIGRIGGYQAQFRVYTVPGQVFYEASRKLILKSVDGVVFVADSQKGKESENIASLAELERNLAMQNVRLYEDVALVLQFNKQDSEDAMSIGEMAAVLQKSDAPCFAAAAVTGDGVMETFQAIIRMTVANINMERPQIKV
ncbi:MAG TPA: GTPase domain-containing protein [Pyrinomonadaceae bacterium]|nr:GTPase domain-containing protein [Pyrinomonadaceae bacterium]